MPEFSGVFSVEYDPKNGLYHGVYREGDWWFLATWEEQYHEAERVNK